MSTQRSAARRRRSEIEDNEDGDILRSSQQSSPSSNASKRARTNGRDSPSDSENESPEPEKSFTNSRRRTVNGVSQNGELDGSKDGNTKGASKFQPGAIVRVKLLNFITYTKAEFFPGPNLNMVIGPNGTGKSSLVCAICLGLGWDPKHLGRASQISEFVKHNEKHAIVEVELQGRANENKNHTVRLKIIRDGNGREWFYNGKKTSLKAIQTLMKGLSIQIDNLCQFLPQDKVSEFAALSPVELLIQTQRAAAPEQMLEWHEALKKYRKDQKETEGRLEGDKEQLHSLEIRQESLRVEVQRLEERNQIQKRVEVLRKTIPFVEYSIARADHMRLKADKKNAQIRLRNLRRQVEPNLQLANHKEDYVKQITLVVKERKKALQTTESAADNVLRIIEDLTTNIQANDKEVEAEREAGRKRKSEYTKLERNIVDLTARASGPEPDFNGASYNERIRAKESESRKIRDETVELQIQNKALEERGRANREEMNTAQQQLGEFDSQEGQQMNRLANFSRDTATAWKWVQEHMGEFEQEVYGPPVITCSVKNPKYTAVVEAQLGRKDVITLTAQTQSDWTKLTDQLLGKMRLFDIVVRRVSSSLAHLNRPPLSSQDLNRFGLDGWALDYIDGPEPVLAMLCGSKKMHATAVTLREITDEQHYMLVSSACSAWVTPNSSNRVNKRSEYGSGATSTTTMAVRAPGFWTDTPVDNSARREIERKIESLTQAKADLLDQVIPIRAKMNENRKRIVDITNEVQVIKDEKAVNQKAHGEWAALPAKIARDEELMEKKKVEIQNLQQRVRDLYNQRDEAIADKAAQSLKHKDIIERIRRCHEEYIEASVRLIEGQSDIEALKDRNRDIVTRLEEEELLVQAVERDTHAAHERATRAMETVRDITAAAEAAGDISHFKNLPNDLTVESVTTEMEAEANKLNYIHAGNPNAIRDFERRQAEVDAIKEKVNGAQDKLEKFARSIAKIRGKWEPELDKLIRQISDAFAYNFEQIGCVGEVGIHKDEDFDQWAIQIKVKFRENESLEILDQHRQSGGERSVSTIFYLMSLQALARAPFRVVDEINQGMDPRNERMVHERMVEIACKEHTSQYFLITPKLLTNLRYDKRMKVHCIASGEHMPADHTRMEVQKIIALRRAIVAVG